MKRILALALLFSIFFIASCSESLDPEFSSGHAVGGIVLQAETPVANARVTLDPSNLAPIRSNAEGRFEFAAVPPGEYNLSARRGPAADSTSEAASEVGSVVVVVQGDTALDPIELPQPVGVNVAPAGAGGFVVSWNRADASGFREYRLYRAATGAADSTAGELVHQATSRDDTTFTDPGPGVEGISYRVYSIADGATAASTVETAALTYSVAGVVYQSGSPLANAQVELEPEVTVAVQTNAEGRYVFLSVPPGEYQVVARRGPAVGESTTEASESGRSAVSVSENTEIGPIVLPRPVGDLVIDTGLGEVVLAWTRAEADGFREYRLYRAAIGAADSTAGELLYRATTINDTTFVDDAPGVDQWSYRVFALANGDRAAASPSATAEAEQTILRVTVDYSGSELIDADHMVFLSITTDPNRLGTDWFRYIRSNGGSLGILIEGTELADALIDGQAYGPFYIGAFVDAYAAYDASGTCGIPYLSPGVIHGGADLFAETIGPEAQTVMISAGEITNVAINFDGRFRSGQDQVRSLAVPWFATLPVGGRIQIHEPWCNEITNDDSDCLGRDWQATNPGVVLVGDSSVMTAAGVGQTIMHNRSDGYCAARQAAGLEVVPREPFGASSVLAGQSEGPGITNGALGTDRSGYHFTYTGGIGNADEIRLDINADGQIDIIVRSPSPVGIFDDVTFYIRPQPGCLVAMDASYNAVADSIVHAEMDSINGYPPVYPQFGPFAARLAPDEVIDESLGWTDDQLTVTYFVRGDDPQVIGPWVDETTAGYAAVRMGTPPNVTYGWLEVTADSWVISWGGQYGPAP